MDKTATPALSNDWLTWLGLAFEVLGKLDWLNVLLVGSGFVTGIMLIIWQMRPGDGFDMRSMFAGRGLGPDGRERWTVEPGRVFQTAAFGVTTWALVWQVTHDKITELMALGYVVLWAGSRALNQIVASKYPVAPGALVPDLPASPPSVVTTTTTEVKP